MPLFSSATGDGCEKVQRAFVQPTPYLHSAVERGLSGIAVDALFAGALVLPGNGGLAGEPRSGRVGRAVFCCSS
jgi:hypothetical protein